MKVGYLVAILLLKSPVLFSQNRLDALFFSDRIEPISDSSFFKLTDTIIGAIP